MLAKLIIPLGIATLVFLFLTVISGIYMRKLKLKLIHHKILAMITLTLGIAHALLVLLIYL